ncbi:FecCD family ABC transporter permease [Paenibacillus terrigena]|uniref:FecCD family ABC transporter permease n=1 Tax=Paenibacillus terrigena TaxID=369333 RepID=UPI0003755462|nr:iron ABC transporter permease [Paenibacillus terrigena]
MLVHKKATGLTIGLTFVLLILAIIVSMGLGSVQFSPVEIIKALFGHGGEVSDTILWDIRIPRVMLAAVIGINLALSGAMLQAVMNNPLADPGLTGVSSGASVAVLFILLVVPQFSSFIPFAAIIGGSLSALMVYALAWKKRGITPIRVILAGVAVNSVFGGIIGLLSLLYSDKLPGALQWLNGSLSGKGMGDLRVMLPYSVIGWIVALFCIRQANILRLGEQVALNLGESLNRVRIILSFVAVYLAAVSVSTVGMIGFVGLVVPHMARMLVGSDYKHLIPMSIGLGALVLLVADTIGRTFFAPLDIPAGIVMAVVGGPYFLYLMRKGDV